MSKVCWKVIMWEQLSYEFLWDVKKYKLSVDNSGYELWVEINVNRTDE